MRILVVEDDFVSRKLFTRILADFGTCDTAVNGLEAVDAYRQAWDACEPYDLILMDIMMPHLSGLEALERIREMERERGIALGDSVRVIIVTAVDDPKNVSRAFFQGAAMSYLIKPIDKKKLIEEVRRLGFLK